MNSDLDGAVAAVTSFDRSNSRFGTGFYIRQDESWVYLVTCSHVLDCCQRMFFVARSQHEEWDVAIIGKIATSHCCILSYLKGST
jgi:hypothetical protein